MFQTLKAQNGVLGDLEYVVQSSVSASDRVKTKKQPACTRCKMKKLKCIIESDSCEKCLERGVRCSYRGPGGPKSRNSPSTSRSRRSPSYQNSPPRDLQLPQPEVISNESTAVQVSKTASNNGSPQSGVSNSDSGYNSARDSNEMDTCLTVNEDEDPCSTFVDPMIGTPSFMVDFSSWTPGLAPESHSSTLAALPEPTLHAEELHDYDICFCLDLIISANATMQVKVVWGAMGGNADSSIDDVLQCQKDVLASCETLLNCNKCRLRSDYVVMVISMCQEMTNGVKSLEAMTSPDTVGLPTNNTTRLGSGGWRLDDDDEIEVIRHLIQIRITRLRKLINHLELTVGANHALYLGIVSALRRCLDDS
ncbi:hypothetical protein F5Y18DRAFT_192382 [Xylariaceae sp. FL1019]|nr:hypothetical protein F5Y18DRAFT_192382 [Xylariaceae sp. FL1019]